MGISSTLWQAILRRRYAKVVPDRAWVELLMELEAPLHKGERWGADGYFDPVSQTTLPRPDRFAKMLLSNREVVRRLRVALDIKFQIESHRLLAQFCDLTVALETRSDLYTLAEVFGDEIYGIDLNRPSFVIDIGANVGFSALYFASRYDSEVVAFELFPATAGLAQANFDLNPDLARRIELKVEGLSDANSILELPYDPEGSAGMGIFNPSTNLPLTAVQIRDVNEVFPGLLERAGDRLIVLKVDCEGAEYAIFDRLLEVGGLSAVDSILLETHPTPNRNADEICALLRDEGFRYFRQGSGFPGIEMIRASRTRER